MNPTKLINRPSIAALLFASMLLAACQSATAVPTLPPVLTETSVQPKSGTGPNVQVDDQSSDGKTVVVRDVFSQGPGWIAIHRQNADGSVGEAIGHAAVHDGDNRNVIVSVDSTQVSSVMYAMLHTDAGSVGVYEFPGPDEPVFTNGAMITPPFKWSMGTASILTPAVVVSDQDVKAGVVMVSRVVSNGPGWIVILTKNPDGTPGKEIGFAQVQDGENQDVNVTIDPTDVTASLIAELYVDAGQVGTFEGSGPDVPVQVGDQVVASNFNTSPSASVMGSATMTPTQVTDTGSMTVTPTAVASTTTTDNTMGGMAMGGSDNPSMVEVADQTIISDTVVVSSVVSNGPGWVVIYTDDNNQPGEIIGSAPVSEGESRYVVVHIDSSKATPTLFALVHVDAGKVGTFEFPGPDSPLMLGAKMVEGSFNITQAAQPTPQYVAQLVKVSSQEIRGGTVRIDEVHSQGPGWIGIHIVEPDGTLGPPIGDAHVDDGVTKNLIVKIKTNLATSVMVAMLHYDGGTVGVWEFPNTDAPVEGDVNIVMPSFSITGGLPTDSTVIKLGQASGIPILVDGAGYTLYTSLNDAQGQSTCDDTCRLTWLPLVVNVKLSVQDGVSSSKLGLITLSDGSRQVTYGGYPLYYFAGDIQPGDNFGQGTDGAWFAGQP